jgi:tetratricopeptide (TPR) repeat protein
MKELLNWLQVNQLEKHNEILIENDITNLALLAELSEEDIKELGFSMGDRKRFALGIKSVSDKVISKEDLSLLSHLPYVIAYPLQQTLLEKNAPQRLNYFRDTFLNYLKYLGLLTASEFFNSPFKERKIVDLFLQNLAQPSFGSWNAFTRECLQYLKNQNHQFFCPDLAAYYEAVETGKKRKMYNGEIEVVDSYNGGETNYIKQTATGIGMLINFRNRYLGHGLTLDTTSSEKLWNEYFPIFRTLLEQLTFCEKFPMLKQESAVYYSLQGIEIKPFESNITIDANVSIYNRDTNLSMPIIPFFIIPGELAIENDEKANIMSYESNNGKTITFFSPEGITKQTSGKILERLNLLLRDKQKEIPFTPANFTKEVFLARIVEENELMLKSLLNEKKVIEGIYQHREEMEIKLREWVGARANIFFIAAEAGTGKTNLLVEIQKQYAERSLASLFIRASRMEKTSLKDELCYQLNMDVSLDIAQYKSLAGIQAEPTFILIDGLNEANNSEAIWKEILEISSVFEPGSLKFVITNRANSKTVLKRYVIEEEQMQYIYGENKDHEASLGAFAFWLTPLSMKEMEGAWNSYVAKDKNRFKPLFSFNDIATFDRALYLQINNPLILRIFLETYKGKKLPKKGAKHLHVWKDWFATISDEEQNFMRVLADAVWEHGENELLLDTVLNIENLQPYFLTDSISAPYQRLLTLGWISRYVKDMTFYVSFTVEGFLLYLLGAKLNQQDPVLRSKAIGEILDNGTKLQKAAIESFLCEQALEGKIDLITQLIDDGDEKLELCIAPLLYFLKSQGVEKTLEKLLENPTENDWKILTYLKYKLSTLHLFDLEDDLLEKSIPLNRCNNKEAILFRLESSDLYPTEVEKLIISLVNVTSSFDYHAHLKIGENYLKWDNPEVALECFEKSLQFYLKKNIIEDSKSSIIYQNIGRAWRNKKKYDKALEFYNKSLQFYLKNEEIDNFNLAIVYEEIGIVWQAQKEYEKALICFEKSLTISIKILGIENVIVQNTYFLTGNCWERQGDFEKAINCYEKSFLSRPKLKNNRYEFLDFSLTSIVSVYIKMGEKEERKKNYQKAIEFYQKGIKHLLNFDTSEIDKYDLLLLYFKIGNFLKNQNEYESSISYLSQCLTIDEEDMDSCFCIAQCYEKINQKPIALQYYIKTIIIFESVCFGDIEDWKSGIEVFDKKTDINPFQKATELARELSKESELPDWMK